MKSLSLRNRILLPIVTLIIIGMLISGILSSTKTTDIISTIIEKQLELVTQNLSTQISAWINDVRDDLETQSELEFYQELLLSEGDPNHPYVAITNNKLETLHKRYGIYDSLIVLGENGIALAATDQSLIGKLNLSDRAYVQQCLQEGKLTVSDTLKSRVTDRPVVALAQPLLMFDKVAGVLIATLDLTKFSETFILPIKIGKHGYAYMTDQKGTVSAHPEANQILSMNLNSYDWGQELLTRQNGTLVYKHNDIEKIVSFRTEPMTGWVIAAGADIDDIFGAVNELITANTVISAIVVLCLIAVILLIVRPIVRAVSQGVNFAKEIQQGNLSSRLLLKRRDELGELADALDSMADSLQERAELAEAIAAGDLSREVTLSSDQDVLGRALRTMTDQLNTIISQINSAGEQIDSGSGQVSESAQDLSQGATEQAASIEEIGASLSELAGRTQNNAQNADTASQLAVNARKAANSGSQQMQSMVAAMAEINESGQNISRIIKTIDEIAFQTNLLALNAAVEAARAGQHGKGFAVVAEEVRNLAARSAKAASETAELIEGSVQKGENGTSIARETAASFEEIVNEIGKTADLIGEIAVSSKEQSEGLVQVNDGVAQIDQVTQRNTAGAEESAAAAEQLSSQSAHLCRLLQHFNLRNESETTTFSANHPINSLPLTTVTPASTDQSSSKTVENSREKQIQLDSTEFGRY